MTDIKLDKLKEVFARRPEVALAYLFGSQASKTTGPLSDVDIAVYLDEPKKERRNALQLELLGELGDALGTEHIDLVILNDASSPELKYHIIKDGAMLFEREPFRVLVEPRILNDYFDFRYLVVKYGLSKAI